MSWRRATSDTVAPGAKVSSTIRALSSADHRRRPPTPVSTSKRRTSTGLGSSVGSNPDTKRSAQRDRHHHRADASGEGGVRTPLTLELRRAQPNISLDWIVQHMPIKQDADREHYFWKASAGLGWTSSFGCPLGGTLEADALNFCLGSKPAGSAMPGSRRWSPQTRAPSMISGFGSKPGASTCGAPRLLSKSMNTPASSAGVTMLRWLAGNRKRQKLTMCSIPPSRSPSSLNRAGALSRKSPERRGVTLLG